MNTDPASSPAAAPERPTPPWIFLFLDLPFGAAVGFLSIVVPFWMERRGHPLEAIAAVAAGATLAHTFKLAWIPLLDLGAYRKVWYLAMAASTAAVFLVIGLLPDPMGNLPLFTVLLTVLQATATTGHAANNTLMATTTRFEDKGKVGGFAQASNVGGTGLLAAAALLVADRTSPRLAAFLMAAVVLASAAMALRIVEPRRFDPAVARAGSLLRAGAVHVREMMRDLWSTIRSREGATGLVICLAPVGCQAMSNLFSGVSREYGASAELVSFTIGVGGGLLAAAGALIGGFVADRMNRRVAYALSGGLTAISAVAMALAPMTPTTYAWGTLSYLFAGGIAFATWTGMVLEMVGLSAAAATKYALFNASANFAITYVTAANGFGGALLHARTGLSPARGALYTDAVLTAIGIVVLVALIALVRRSPGGSPEAARSAAPASGGR